MKIVGGGESWKWILTQLKVNYQENVNVLLIATTIVELQLRKQQKLNISKHVRWLCYTWITHDSSECKYFLLLLQTFTDYRVSLRPKSHSRNKENKHQTQVLLLDKFIPSLLRENGGLIIWKRWKGIEIEYLFQVNFQAHWPDVDISICCRTIKSAVIYAGNLNSPCGKKKPKSATRKSLLLRNLFPCNTTAMKSVA